MNGGEPVLRWTVSRPQTVPEAGAHTHKLSDVHAFNGKSQRLMTRIVYLSDGYGTSRDSNASSLYPTIFLWKKKNAFGKL